MRYTEKKWSGYIWLLCIAIFLAETAYGIYMGYFQESLLGDAVSRTANAYYVFNVKPYRFSSMGLVWNPLPSTLQLPFILLAKLWKPFASRGVGAAIMTAAFAAMQAGVLLNTFEKFGINRKFSVTAVLLYCCNPYMFFYGANGMSEMISFFFTVWSICSLSLWVKSGESKYLIKIGVALVGLFFTRYEAVPYGMALGAAMILFILFSKRERFYWRPGGKKECYFYIEGTMVLTFLPVVYAGLLWIFYNWVITGDPLYFMTSGYSIQAYSDYYTAQESFLAAVEFVGIRVAPFLPLLFAFIGMRLLSGRLLKTDVWMVTITAITLILFQFIMTLRNSSGGYVRYMCYSFPICMAWMPYDCCEHKGVWGKIAKSVYGVVLAGLFLWFAWAFQSYDLIREDALLKVPEGSVRMADYLEEHVAPGELILMDAYRGYNVMLNMDSLEYVITSSSENFYDYVEDPAGMGISYILVPESESYGNMDALNIAYPDLWDSQGNEWCQLEVQIEEYKLFRIIR